MFWAVGIQKCCFTVDINLAYTMHGISGGSRISPTGGSAFPDRM